MINNNFDIYEFYENHKEILSILLLDRTSNKNIIWATDNYIRRGYSHENYIIVEAILQNRKIIKPRINKSQTEQKKRSKVMAEVFTPSWICNNQNNLVDNAWFGYDNVFNIEQGESWKPTDKVEFRDLNYIDYINDIRLEITCGEAPYLVSRYDTVSGNEIPLMNRIGFLDRKFRIIKENVHSDEEWINNALLALKSIYGYEFQGDNLFIARQNVFISFIEYYYDRFNELPNIELLTKVATIISWNLWQMDGLKMVIPYSCTNGKIEQANLFGEIEIIGDDCLGCKNNDIKGHNGKYAVIMDWKKNKKVKFVDMIKYY